MSSFFSLSKLTLLIAALAAFATALIASNSLELAPFGMAASDFEPALIALIAALVALFSDKGDALSA